MTLSRLSVDTSMAPTYSCCSAVSADEASSRANPCTPFMGVRISWDMLARNWLLALLLVCARSLPSVAARRDLLSSSSMRFMRMRQPYSISHTTSITRQKPPMVAVTMAMKMSCRKPPMSVLLTPPPPHVQRRP